MIDEETCKERTYTSIWMSQGHVLHHYRENYEKQSWWKESVFFPSEKQWHLRRRCCVPTFCTASEERCYVKPPAYCAYSHKPLRFDSLGKKNKEVVSFAMHTRKIFSKSLGLKTQADKKKHKRHWFWYLQTDSTVRSGDGICIQWTGKGFTVCPEIELTFCSDRVIWVRPHCLSRHQKTKTVRALHLIS